MPAASAIPRLRGQRLVLDAISWQTYDKLGRALQDRPIRLTFDRGQLEIMTLSPKHERWRHLLRRLIEALCDELETDIAGFGSMTFKRRKLARGLEPDECFWIQHERQMRSKTEYDPADDPPPDLVLEVEVTRSVMDRLSIYLALRVPEVWRFDGQQLHVLLLSDKDTYEPSRTSRAIPHLRPSALLPFLRQVDKQGEAAMLRNFRKWARARVEFSRPRR